MTRSLALLAYALAAPTSVPTMAAQIGAFAVRDAAQELAATVLPRDAVIAVRIPRFEVAYADELKRNARLTTLEKTLPGITKAVAAAARDEAAKGYGTAVDLLQADVAKLYRENFTSAELVKLIGFFSSRTGKAMVALSAGSSGDSATAFEADRHAKAVAYIQNLDEAGKADLKALMESGLLPKVRAMRRLTLIRKHRQNDRPTRPPC